MRAPWWRLSCWTCGTASPFVLPGLCSVLALGLACLASLAAPPARAGSGAATKRERPAREPLRVAAELFRRHCSSCHAADGTGSGVRDRLPQVPDFTDPRWQERTSHAHVVVTILEGKGGRMPAFRGKLGPDQAEELAALIRTFDPTYDPASAQRGAPGLDDFGRRFRQLEAEMAELRKQFRELSAPAGKP